jgi:hypothetical protein
VNEEALPRVGKQRQKQSRRWWVVKATPRPLYPRGRLDAYCVGRLVRTLPGLDGCDPRTVQYVPSCCTCYVMPDRLCGLVVRVSGYRYRGPGFDPRRYQIF